MGILEKWTIEELLGEGAYGKVYKISRREFGYTYYSALKVITIPKNVSEVKAIAGADEKSARAYYQSMVENIVSEFATMTKLRGNTNIVSCEDYEVIPHKDRIGWDILIRMELLLPILEYTKEYTFTTKDIVKMGIDICNALEVCQKYEIIHRDIKPANIFLSEMNAFKLGDFGIARKLENVLDGLSRKGTYTYMAPEIYKGERYDATVDIYSLGLVLYRYLNKNRLPFYPSYPQQITYTDGENALTIRMSGEPLLPPCDAPYELSQIVLKATAYNPRERYQDVKEMKKALEEFERKNMPAAKILQKQETEEEPSERAETVNEAKPVKKQNKNVIKGIVIMVSAIILLTVGILLWRVGFGNVAEKDNTQDNIVQEETSGEKEEKTKEEKTGEDTDEVSKTRVLAPEMVSGVWEGAYIGMSNDKKTQKKIRIYVGDCDEEGKTKGVAEIEEGEAGYYYWEGQIDFEKGSFSFERKAWLSENPDHLKKLTYNMTYNAEEDGFQGVIVSDPERTIALGRGEDDVTLRQFYTNREALMR